MHCLFVVPDLFWPDTAARDAYAELAVPALERLLARGRKRITEVGGLDGWLARAFGFEDGTALPAAPYRLAGEGTAPGDEGWLCADPVHLRVDRDRLVLADGALVAPDAEEARAIVATLNEHFASDGLAFLAPAPDRWYLRTQALPQAGTPSPREARGRTLHAVFGEDPADGRWRALSNEIQMLLHEHPVNVARENRGAAAINGLWLWGAGRWRALSVTPPSRWLSRDPLVAGLAQAAGQPSGGVPGSFEALARGGAGDGVVTLVLDTLSEAAAYGDLASWREALAALERDWCSPALDALRAGHVGMVSIHAVGETSTLQVETTAGDLRYFWRRNRALASYVNG